MFAGDVVGDVHVLCQGNPDQPVIAMPAQLQHLAQAYFHQDYDIDFGEPDLAVAAFAEGEGRGAVRELISEIDRLLGECVADSELSDLWVRAFGASYDPTVGGGTQREWFVHVRGVLAGSLGSGGTSST